jgi:hypothetical protein
MLACFALRSAAGGVALTLLLLGHPAAARDSAIYTVRGVSVDETAESAAAARDIALAKAQTDAWRRLIDRLVPKTVQTGVPPLTPAAQVELVSGIDVEGEKTSSVRYLATLTVRFNADAVRTLLRSSGIPFAEAPGKPLVVLPVYRAAGTVQLWDGANLWLQAWHDLPPSDGLVPLIVPKGDAADIAAVSAQQALNGEAARLEAISRRHDAAGAVLAAATLRHDDAARTTVLEVVLSRFGSAVGDSISVRSFTGESGTPVANLLAAAAATRDEIVEGWKQDNLIRFGERRELVAVAPIAGLADWVTLRRRLAEMASVETAELLSLSLRWATLRLHYFGDEEQLAQAFAQRDMELRQGSVGWQLQLRPGDRMGTTGAVSDR